eukprot:scpid109861/ scgid35142/ 
MRTYLLVELSLHLERTLCLLERVREPQSYSLDEGNSGQYRFPNPGQHRTPHAVAVTSFSIVLSAATIAHGCCHTCLHSYNHGLPFATVFVAHVPIACFLC